MLRLQTPPGSRIEVRRKAGLEQAGIREPPPSFDARRSFPRPTLSQRIFARRSLTALKPPRHSLMLDVDKKMYGYRAGARVRDDGIAAELREQFDQFGSGGYRHADNPDSDTDLWSVAVERRLHAIGTGPDSAWCPGLPTLGSRAVQLQRRQLVFQHQRVGNLVRG